MLLGNREQMHVYCVGQGFRIKVARLPHLTCCADSLWFQLKQFFFIVVAILLILPCQDVMCA